MTSANTELTIGSVPDADVLLRLATELEARAERSVHAVSSQNGTPVAIGAMSEAVAERHRP